MKKHTKSLWDINSFCPRKILLIMKLTTFFLIINLLQISGKPVENLQQQKVTGTVIDASTGEPIIGANIIIEGTTLGVVTDVNGKYSIDVPGTSAVLVITYIGYISEKIAYSGQSSIDIKLIPDITKLEEIVVVGYGTQKKVNMTGAVSTVDSKEIESRPVSNVGQALQGLVPGLDISSNSGGYINGGPAINIRGIATIGSSNGGPLVLIDGMEGDMSNLNPRDIENISVLKDAAASSIYGSRAPFGVILITTKKGTQGKLEVSYNSDFRWNSPLHLAKQVNGYEFALFTNQAMENFGMNAFFPDATLNRVKDVVDGKGNSSILIDPNNPNSWNGSPSDYAGNTNWNKVIYRDWAPSQNHSLSFRGGTEKMSYFISGEYLDQNGVVKLGGDNKQRYNLTAKIEAKLTKWATLSYNGKFTRTDYSAPSYLNDWQFFGNRSGYNTWSIVPSKDPNGNYWRADQGSPLFMMDGGRQMSQNDALSQQLNLTLEPVKGWKIYANLNFRVNSNTRHDDNRSVYNYDVNKNPIPVTTDTWIYEDAWRENYFNSNIYTDYTKSLGDHNFKIMAGIQTESLFNHFLGAKKRGMLLETKPILDLTSGNGTDGKPFPNEAYSNDKEWKILGYFGRFNYDYNGRYLAEVNLRSDGTSRYLGDAKRKLFPSFSLGWNVAKEAFFSDLSNVVNTLKIRGSFGDIGNQNLGNNFYQFYQTMPFYSGNGDWLVGGVRPNRSLLPNLVNPGLTWETIRTYNGGLDIDMLNNKLSATFDYFNRLTLNSTGPAYALPKILGTDPPQSNNTDIKTYGFELSLNWKEQLQNGLAYSVRLLLSDNQTKVLRYSNPTGDLGWWGAPSFREGAKIGEIWGYETIGIAQTDQEMADHLATLPDGGQNALGSGTNWKAGDIMYKDLNGDGKISQGANTIEDHGDLKVIGNRTPRYRIGVDLTTSWKGFDFRAFLQGVLQQDYFNSTSYFWGYDVNNSWNAPWGNFVQDANMDYWRDENNILGANPNAYFPRPISGDPKNNQVQTRYIQNATYIRLKNLQLGYSLPHSIIKKFGVQKLRIYVSGENLFTWTKMTDLFDPELIGGGQMWWNPGSTYPLSKVISAGININF